MDKKRIIVLTALEVIVLYMIIFAIYGIMPFGDKLLYTWDLQGQYADFFVWYRDALLGKTDIRYSLIGGFGGGTATFFAYYLASPFNLILLFFNRATMPIGVWLLIMIKLVAMAVSMALYLYRKRPSATASLCGLCYAACGYVVGFGSNVMWLDALIFLPWIIGGLDDLLYAGKTVKYSVFLGLVLLANFYTGYMVCFFIVVYFLIQFIVYPRWKSIWQFIYSSVLGGMLSAVLLMPAFCGLHGRGNTSQVRWDAIRNFTKLYLYKDVLWAYAPGHFRQVQLFEINWGSAPLLYVGLLPLLGIVCMLFAKHLSVKQKVANVVLLALVQLSMNHMNLFTILHGMDTPHGAPWRYAFLWSFSAIIVGYHGLVWLEEKLSTKALRVACYGIVTTLLMAELTWNAVDTWNNSLGFDSAKVYGDFISRTTEYYQDHADDLKTGKRTNTIIDGMRDTNDAYVWNKASVTGYTSTMSVQNENMLQTFDEVGVDFSELPLALAGEISLAELQDDNKNYAQSALELDARHISSATIDMNQQAGFAKNEDALTITVPYEENWEAYADGKRISISEDVNGFLKLQGVKNANQVKIHYTTNGLGLGIVMTLIAGTAIIMIGMKQKRKFK